MELLLEPLRTVTQPIDRILNCFLTIFRYIFSLNDSGGPAGSGPMSRIISTILNNPYLLVSVSLVIIGFVIGVIKRMINC